MLLLGGGESLQERPRGGEHQRPVVRQAVADGGVVVLGSGARLLPQARRCLEEAERRIEILNERGELKPAPAALGLPGDEER